MEKKIKVLLWTSIGIIAVIIVSSILLAFFAPSHLITLWAGIIGGSALGLLRKYRKESVEALKGEADYELPTPVIAEMDSFTKVEWPKEEVVKDEREEVVKDETVAVEAEKPSPAKKTKAPKKRAPKKK